MKIVPEPERMDARVPLGLTAIALAILLLSALLTIGIRSISVYDRRAPAAGGPRPIAPADAPAAQPSALFDRYLRAPATRELPAKLRGYGWVNREQGLVRIPIERAKQLYLARTARPTQPVSHSEGGSQ